MTGYFFNGVVREDERADYGVYTHLRGVDDPQKATELIKDDKAFRVEVSQLDDGVNINLISDSREVDVELDERIEYRGLSDDLYQFPGDPVMPADADDPHRAVSMYAQYALKHGAEGLEAEVEWEKVLDEENRGL